VGIEGEGRHGDGKIVWMEGQGKGGERKEVRAERRA
jgi:hypothetical protein